MRAIDALPYRSPARDAKGAVASVRQRIAALDRSRPRANAVLIAQTGGPASQTAEPGSGQSSETINHPLPDHENHPTL